MNTLVKIRLRVFYRSADGPFPVGVVAYRINGSSMDGIKDRPLCIVRQHVRLASNTGKNMRN
jgi:hypothetical protein